MSNRVATEHEMQAISDAVLSRQRERYGAAPTTVETLMYELRTLGLAAVAGPNCRRRLAEVSTAQLRETIERLTQLRPDYPAITEDFLFKLRGLL